MFYLFNSKCQQYNPLTMAKKLRIAFISDGIYPLMIGGMQKHSFNVIKEFLLKDIDLTLFHFVLDTKSNALDFEKSFYNVNKINISNDENFSNI